MDWKLQTVPMLESLRELAAVHGLGIDPQKSGIVATIEIRLILKPSCFASGLESIQNWPVQPLLLNP